MVSLVAGMACALVMASPGSAGASPSPDGASPSPAARFLASQGFAAPPPLYVRALDAFIAAEGAYRRGHYREAGRVLDALWATHPPGTDEWASAYRQAWEIGQTHGINVGCPPCYYALRMLTECVRWRRSDASRAKPFTTTTLTVLLVGKATGAQPRTTEELERGLGGTVELALEPSLSADRGRLVRDSLWLFTEYMTAASDGRLGARTEVLHLPELTVPVAVTMSSGRRFAGLSGDAWRRIWQAVPDQVRGRTDWWWVIYPSCIPEQHPDFTRTEFITGGMGTGPDGTSPCFIIDDRWLTRKPPHLGLGPYTEVERRAYLPQWLQHEFYHHLFRIYPAFGLEDKDHQWFDRKTWPKDFVGRIEPDYYAEALAKRIQPIGAPPLHIALRYAPPPLALFRTVSLDDLVGEHRHEPVQNDWHVGALTRETVDGQPGLRWTNKAGATWTLKPDLTRGLLRTGQDCPYYDANDPDASPFRILLERDTEGRWTPRVSGFVFNGGTYRRTSAPR